LDNLDIENIEIVLSTRPKNKPENQFEKHLNLDIEKLLSEEDEDDYKSGEDEYAHHIATMDLKSKNLKKLAKDDTTLKCIGNNFSRMRRLQIFEEITVDEEK
jgi:hypothetical protein